MVADAYDSQYDSNKYFKTTTIRAINTINTKVTES